MKRTVMFVGFLILFSIFTACSSKPSLELVNSEVEITNDKDKVGAVQLTEGNNKGKEIAITSLYYQFKIKNIGNKKIGEEIGEKGLQVKLEPNKKLIAAAKEAVGFNIFEPSAYDESGVGYGSSFKGVIKPNKTEDYILIFDLGVDEENNQYRLVTPPKEKLQTLKENALDATLIVTLDGKEISRFDLKNK